MSVKDVIILGCSAQQPTRKRNHGAYLVRWNEEGLLFDPGEGTQRQFIFADIAPTVVSRIFVSHFHGDHCLGLGSMLMRLNLDKVQHPIHCYYPARYKKNFDALRYGCIYHENIHVIEHPVKYPGLVHADEKFEISADFMQHGVQTVGWRVKEKDQRKFNKEALKKAKVQGPLVKKLEEEKELTINGEKVFLEDVSRIKKGEAVAVALDTRYCQELIDLAKDAAILITESTYLEDKKDLAKKYNHMTAKEAASAAKKAGVKKLILTHFSARYSDNQAFEKEARKIFPNSFAAEDFKRFSFPESKNFF